MPNDIGADLTKKFFSKWDTKDPVMQKQAEYAVSSYVREKLRENGIMRSQILPALTITDGQFDKDEDPKILKKFIEVEPDSKATWIPFRGMPESRIIQSRLSPVYFGKIESEEHRAVIWELKNYSNDLRKILNDQDIKNIQTQEDTAFIGRLNEIVAANPAEQDKNFYGGLTKVTWAQARQAFYINKPLRKALMNSRTHIEFIKWKYDEDMGYGTSGSDAFTKGTIPNAQGIDIIQTIKDDLVPDGVVWLFSEPDFIGKFFTYQEPTTFVKQEKDWISFSTYEIIGIGIGNTRSFIKCTFNA